MSPFRRRLDPLLLAPRVTACRNSGPTTPTASAGGPAPAGSSSAAPSTPAPPLPPATLFDISGTVADDRGQPIAGARIAINFVASAAGLNNPLTQLFLTTDGLGTYSTTFTAVPGAMSGPVGTESPVAFAWAEGPNCWPEGTAAYAYEGDSRYVLTTGDHLSQNFHLYRIERITAGSSASLTVSPNDAICSNNAQDFHPSPVEFVCGTLRVVAPSDGTLKVAATSPSLEVQSNTGPFFFGTTNPFWHSVSAGTHEMVNVELPWGSVSQAFVVNTSNGLWSELGEERVAQEAP